MLWAEPSPSPQRATDNEMVLTLRPTEIENIVTPLMVTCGKIQILNSPEPTTFDLAGKTVMSIKLALAAAKTDRPELTRESLMKEKTNNQKI